METLPHKETRRRFGNVKKKWAIYFPAELNPILEQCEMEGIVKTQNDSDKLVVMYEFQKKPQENVVNGY